MALTRNIDKDRVRRAIVHGILETCRELKLGVIAEGIVTAEECLVLQDEGDALFQGYLFTKPVFQHLPKVSPDIFALVKPLVPATGGAGLASPRNAPGAGSI